jgi:hypothetical protein
MVTELQAARADLLASQVRLATQLTRVHSY